jgi:hypothetical protein
LGELSLSPTLAPHFRNGDNLAAGSALPRPFHSLSILPLSSEQELKNKVSKKRTQEQGRTREKERKEKKRKRKKRKSRSNQDSSSQGGNAHNHLHLHSWVSSKIPSPFFLKSPLKPYLLPSPCMDGR